MLKAYFDESGHTADPGVRAFGIAGLRALCEQWFTFNERWLSLIEPEGIRCFHMKEFYSGHATPYRDWSLEKKERFLMSLLDVIETVKPPIGAMQSLAEDLQDRETIQNAYREAYHGAIRSAVITSPDEAKDHFIFARHEEISREDMADYHKRVMDGYRRVLSDPRVGSIAFGEPPDLPPLQAADYIAWEFRRHVHDPSAVRPTFKRLLAMRPHIYR